MTLLQVTQNLLKTVETRTGRSVLLDDRPLGGTLLSTTRIARESTPAHVILIDPRGRRQTDYLVAWECLHILRVFNEPTEHRFQLSSTSQGETQARQLVASHLGGGGAAGIPSHAIAGFTKQIYDGLLLQLRSVPTGLRIDAHLSSEYPDLAQQQRAAVLHQLEDNAKTLAPSVSQLIPPKIRRASLAMNATFALFWARTWNDPATVVPYQASGFVHDGQALFDLFLEIPETPAHDRLLIDSWGKRLDLDGWYHLGPVM